MPRHSVSPSLRTGASQGAPVLILERRVSGGLGSGADTSYVAGRATGAVVADLATVPGSVHAS